LIVKPNHEIVCLRGCSEGIIQPGRQARAMSQCIELRVSKSTLSYWRAELEADIFSLDMK
jgi:hypothetical protein